MNGKNSKIIETIPVGQDPISIIMNPVTLKLYVLNYLDGNIDVIY